MRSLSPAALAAGRRQWFLPLAAIVLALSALYSGWAAWGPRPEETARLPLFAVDSSAGGSLVWFADISSAAKLRVGWPAGLSVRLTTQTANPIEAGVPPGLIFPARAGQPLPQLEGRVELPGARITPPGTSLSRLDPAREAGLRWEITPVHGGRLAGTLWLYLQGDPPDGERKALLARPLELQAANSLLTPGSARVAAVVQAALASLAAFWARSQGRRRAL